MFGKTLSSPQTLHIPNFCSPKDHLPLAEKGGDFMVETNAETSDRVNPDKASVEDGRNPSTHPMRRGGWLRQGTDPVLRGVEELAMVTGRVERV